MDTVVVGRHKQNRVPSSAVAAQGVDTRDYVTNMPHTLLAMHATPA
jgi:hypothetical protein